MQYSAVNVLEDYLTNVKQHFNYLRNNDQSMGKLCLSHQRSPSVPCSNCSRFRLTRSSITNSYNKNRAPRRHLDYSKHQQNLIPFYQNNVSHLYPFPSLPRGMWSIATVRGRREYLIFLVYSRSRYGIARTRYYLSSDNLAPCPSSRGSSYCDTAVITRVVRQDSNDIASINSPGVHSVPST